MPALTVTPNAAPAGSTVRVDGSGWLPDRGTPDGDIVVYFGWYPPYTPGPLYFTYGPSFTVYLTVPSWPNGEYRVVAMDRITADYKILTFNITAPPSDLEKALTLAAASIPVIAVSLVICKDLVKT